MGRFPAGPTFKHYCGYPHPERPMDSQCVDDDECGNAPVEGFLKEAIGRIEVSVRRHSSPRDDTETSPSLLGYKFTEFKEKRDYDQPLTKLSITNTTNGKTYSSAMTGVSTITACATKVSQRLQLSSIYVTLGPGALTMVLKALSGEEWSTTFNSNPSGRLVPHIQQVQLIRLCYWLGGLSGFDSDMPELEKEPSEAPRSCQAPFCATVHRVIGRHHLGPIHDNHKYKPSTDNVIVYSPLRCQYAEVDKSHDCRQHCENGIAALCKEFSVHEVLVGGLQTKALNVSSCVYIQPITFRVAGQHKGTLADIQHSLEVQPRTSRPVDMTSQFLKQKRDITSRCMPWPVRTNQNHGQLSFLVESVLHDSSSSRPTRLYDAGKKTVFSPSRNVSYLAVSYVWNEWQDEELRQKLVMVSKETSHKYFWVDRWCINQIDKPDGSNEDKQNEIPRMAEYYGGASATIILLSPNAPTFSRFPCEEGQVYSPWEHVVDNQTAMRHLLESSWISRLWTLQEAYLSKRAVFNIGNQYIDGDYLCELIGTLDKAYAFAADRIVTYGQAPTMVIATQLGSASIDQDGVLYMTRLVIGSSKSTWAFASGPTDKQKMSMTEAIALSRGRNATKEADTIYGLSALVHGMDRVRVDYTMALGDIHRLLIQEGLLTSNLLSSSSVNSKDGRCWETEDFETKALQMQVEAVASTVQGAYLGMEERGVTCQVVPFRWVCHSIRQGWTNTISNMTCYAVNGIIEFSGALALVAGLSTEPFNHVRLSADQFIVNPLGQWDVTVIRGKTEPGGWINREDGYVLEIHRIENGVLPTGHLARIGNYIK